MFVSAAQGYDAAMLLAAAIAKAGSTDGEKMQTALESLDGVLGIIRTYNKPFSKTDHEALSVSDFHFARWKDGRVVSYEDANLELGAYHRDISAAEIEREIDEHFHCWRIRR